MVEKLQTAGPCSKITDKNLETIISEHFYKYILGIFA
jgi:hypothetical protein